MSRWKNKSLKHYIQLFLKWSFACVPWMTLRWTVMRAGKSGSPGGAVEVYNTGEKAL